MLLIVELGVGGLFVCILGGELVDILYLYNIIFFSLKIKYLISFINIMDDKQRLQLANMIKVNNVEDQTNLIRNLKHSQVLRNEVNNMILIKAKYRGDNNKINEECINECSFLYTYYTDIFNKVKKDEIDIGILNKFLDVLRQIEDGELDQHDGSFLVGTLLKELYVDSAIKKAEKLDDQQTESKGQIKGITNNISWKQFKMMKT